MGPESVAKGDLIVDLIVKYRDATLNVFVLIWHYAFEVVNQIFAQGIATENIRETHELTVLQCAIKATRQGIVDSGNGVLSILVERLIGVCTLVLHHHIDDLMTHCMDGVLEA